MICPILTIAKCSVGEGKAECEKEGCAWWNNGACVMEHLSNIAITLAKGE